MRRILVLPFALALFACGGSARHAAPPAAAPPARDVEVATVERVSVGGRTVPAVLRARHRAALAARVPATVVSLPYREGEAVAAGAVVARLEDSALRAGLAAADAALLAAEADHRRAEGLRAKDAATPQELDHAAARRAAARAAVAGARDQLAYAVLRAPFAGVVASRPADVGDVVAPGATVIEIEDAGALEVAASVDATEAAGLRPGIEVTVLVGEESLAARVVSLARSGDPATHRFELTAALPPGVAARSGEFARLVLPMAEAADAAPAVPERAVVARGGLTGVFVADGGTARLRWFAAGARAAGRVEVRAGLAEGERVVLDPRGLVDGAPIVVK